MNFSLYELTTNLEFLLEQLAESGGEMTCEVDQAIEQLGEAIEQKIDGCCRVIRQLQSEAAGYDAELERMGRAKQARLNAIENIKDRMKVSLEKIGETKVKTPIFTVSICANSTPSVTIDPSVKPEDLPPQFQRIKVEPANSEIAKAWRADVPLPAGVSVSVGRHIRIR